MHNPEIPIWQAARATSAAPTYFEPMKIALHNKGIFIECIDAAFGFNHPGEALMEEIKALEGPFDEDFRSAQHVELWISLGTGSHEVARLEDDTIAKRLSSEIGKPLAVAKVMEQIVTSTERVHRNLENMLRSSERKYWRFNVENGLQNVKMDDYTKTEQIVVDTVTYLESCRIDRDLCVSRGIFLWNTQDKVNEEHNDKELTRRFQDLSRYAALYNVSFCELTITRRP